MPTTFAQRAAGWPKSLVSVAVDASRLLLIYSSQVCDPFVTKKIEEQIKEGSNSARARLAKSRDPLREI